MLLELLTVVQWLAGLYGFLHDSARYSRSVGPSGPRSGDRFSDTCICIIVSFHSHRAVTGAKSNTHSDVTNGCVFPGPCVDVRIIFIVFFGS